MVVSGVKNATANNDVILLPKGRERAKKNSCPDGGGGLAYFYIWYEKGLSKTSPIYVWIEPQKKNAKGKK